jgi:hypothetical protein
LAFRTPFRRAGIRDSSSPFEIGVGDLMPTPPSSLGVWLAVDMIADDINNDLQNQYQY